MPKLFLTPNILSDSNTHDFFAPMVGASILSVRVFFVEEPKAARRLLKLLNPQFPLSECKYIDLNEHTQLNDLKKNFTELKGVDMAVVSEAGYPCVADPGAILVQMAREEGYEIIPLIGASSIILALAASGLNGQNFAFYGYLPKDKGERYTKIRSMEARCKKEGQTQIFMEAPYRNDSLFEDLLNSCEGQSLLCVAIDIAGQQQKIETKSITQWKQNSPVIPKLPTLFLIQSCG